MHMAVCWNLLASMVIVCRIIEMWTENQYLFPYTIGAFSLEKRMSLDFYVESHS